jgi:sacsin
MTPQRSLLTHGRPSFAFAFICLCVFSQANGYFELSSNRRDIWSGADMAGDGQRRAQWNSALLSDVIAPSYVRLLIQVHTAGRRLKTK